MVLILKNPRRAPVIVTPRRDFAAPSRGPAGAGGEHPPWAGWAKG